MPFLCDCRINNDNPGIDSAETLLDPSKDQVAQRLLNLELQLAAFQRSNRRLKLAIGALALAAGALFGMAQASPNSGTIEARQLLIDDGSGKVRLAIGAMPEGAAGLNIDDASGRTRISLDIDGHGSPGLDLFDQDGKRRALIALGPHGTPGLGLYDASGKLRTSLDVPATNTPGLAFYHQNGKPAWGVP
jgi:hypothetical protein